MNKWEKIGEIPVDSASIVIIDPLYKKYIDELSLSGNPKFENGIVAGVVISPTGDGDGIYSVFVKKNKEGRPSEVKIKFY